MQVKFFMCLYFTTFDGLCQEKTFFLTSIFAICENLIDNGTICIYNIIKYKLIYNYIIYKILIYRRSIMKVTKQCVGKWKKGL